MKFSEGWVPIDANPEHYQPALKVWLRRQAGGYLQLQFVVDSGSEYSIAPKGICDQLGIRWESGRLVHLLGVSRRREQRIEGRIHRITLFIKPRKGPIYIENVQFCFAKGNPQLVLGREGFFDAFRIVFEKNLLMTTFEPL